ncbi:unnamed protein product, partial [Nesidiocoris tenuis]
MILDLLNFFNRSGEFLMEYVGEVIDPKEFRRRAKDYSKEKNRHFYFMSLKSDSIIDATLKGSISRFINHSCDPNAETQKQGGYSVLLRERQLPWMDRRRSRQRGKGGGERPEMGETGEARKEEESRRGAGR